MKRHDSGFWKSIGLSALFLCALLLSCEKKETVAPIQPGEEIFISSAHKGDVPIGEVFSEWRYVPLETTDESLVWGDERIHRIKVSGNGEIYLSDGNILLRFHPDGKFDYCFDHRGQGPEEYDGIWNFNFWKEKDKEERIVIVDIYSSTLLSYTANDEFIFKRRFADWDIRDAIQLDDSLLLIRCSDRKKDIYLYHTINYYTGKEVRKYWKLDEVDQGIFFMKDFLYRYDGKVIYHGYKMNDIYELTKDSAISRYKINVDNKIPPEKFWSQKVANIYQEYDAKGYIGHIPFYVESDNSILLFFDGGKKEDENYAFINKGNRETKVIERFIFEDGFVFRPKTLFSLDDGGCVFLIYPEDILLNAAFAQRFPGLGKESNPVLFLAKIK